MLAHLSASFCHPSHNMLYLLFLFFSIDICSFVGVNGLEPVIVVPSAIRWQADNDIIITPSTADSVDYPLALDVFLKTKSPSRFNKIIVASHRTILSNPGASYHVKLSTRNQIDAEEYELQVKFNENIMFQSSILYGIPDLFSAKIETDKGFYKPGESVAVRVLPLTSHGDLYTNALKISLVNEYGFQVFSTNVTASNRFIQKTLTLPKFIKKPSTWMIVVKPYGRTHVNWLNFNKLIKVGHYDLPQIFVIANAETVSTPGHANITVAARQPHGKVVNGGVYVSCVATFDTKIANGQLENGQWQGEVDISRCSKRGAKSTKIVVLVRADVTGVSERAIINVVLGEPKFELIPLRPYFNERTGVIRIFAKSLTPTVSGHVITGKYRCISDDRTTNGRELPLPSATVDSIIEIEVNSNCRVYAIYVNRRISTELNSESVTLLVPSVSGTVQTMPSKLIQNIKGASFAVGDVVEVRLVAFANYFVVCNSRDIIASGTAPINGYVRVAVNPTMIGECLICVQKQENGKALSDMHLFFVRRSYCGTDISLTSSATEISPPSEITLTAKAPAQSLMILRAIDERLNHIINSFDVTPSQLHWTFSLFQDTPLSREVPSPLIINFINVTEIHQEIRRNCKQGARRLALSLNGSGGYFAASGEVKDVHGICLHEFENQNNMEQEAPLKLSNSKAEDRVELASFFKPPKTLAPRTHDDAPSPAIIQTMRSQKKKILEPVDEVFLRSFFPEVWYFDDLKFGSETIKTVTLGTPHAVGEWAVTSAFWTTGQRETCPAAPLSIKTTRHVFMEVILPERVFLNETITAKVIINSDIFDEEVIMSLCFTGQSPVVCGDMGADGRMAGTDYNRVILNAQTPQAEKSIDLKFFQIGPQNVSFELRTEENVQGESIDHCSLDSATAYDKIVKTVIVEPLQRRDEEYACVVIYAQQPVFQPVENRTSTRDGVIHFKQHTLDTDVETIISLNPDEKIIAMSLEFEEYVEGYPLKPFTSEMGIPIRSQRSTDNQAFAPLLMDLTSATYGIKQARLFDDLPEGSLRQEHVENHLQKLLGQVFSYSNCTPTSRVCAFGEFGPPSTTSEPSVLYTATVASLMCENDIENGPVCGTLRFLANVVDTNFNDVNIDFYGQMDFDTDEERQWFIRAMIAQTFADCHIRSCLRENSIQRIVNNSVEYFYEFNTSKKYDLRVVAAVAVAAPRYMGAMLRARLLDNYDDLRWPSWRTLYSHVVSETSSDVAINSLALLAFVNQSTEVYSHYKKFFNFERLTDWILEQQDVSGRINTPVETFFAWRALYRYYERIFGLSATKSISVSLEGSSFNKTKFTNQDMPISIQVPPTTRNVTVLTHGDGKIIVGVRVFTSGRRRLKRDDIDVPAIQIASHQSRTRNSNLVKQTVCLKINRASFKHVEVHHRLYTGFSTKNEHVMQLPNTTSEAHLETVSASGSSVYLIFTQLSQHPQICYAVVLEEPKYNYNPEFLAPVRIDANYNAIRATHFLDAMDIVFEARRMRRHRYYVTREALLTNGQRRFQRHVIDGSAAQPIDSVCLEHGTCTCAELTCDQTPLTCANNNDILNELKRSLRQPGRFGVIVRFEKLWNHTSPDGSKYCVAKVKENTDFDRVSFGCYSNYSTFNLWIRECTDFCDQISKNGLEYFIVGDASGFFSDAIIGSDNPYGNKTPKQLVTQNYLLRNGDFFEGGVPLKGELDETESCVKLLRTDLPKLLVNCATG